MNRAFLILFLVFWPFYAFAQTGATIPMFGQDQCILWEEEDGSPTNIICGPMRLPNGSLTDNGDGSFSFSGGFTIGDANTLFLAVDGSNANTTIDIGSENLTTSGDITANNLSGTNTGDQDLSGYAVLSGDATFNNLTVTGTIYGGSPIAFGDDINGLSATFSGEVTVGTLNYTTLNPSVSGAFTRSDNIISSSLTTDVGIDFSLNSNEWMRSGSITINQDTLVTGGGQGGIDSYTQLMLHMDGSDEGTTFTDDSGNGRNGTANGNVNTETDYKKFGTASAEFDGSGDYITVADNNAWAFGSSDFTIDWWFYGPAMTGSGTIWYQRTNSNNYIRLRHYTDGDFQLYAKGGGSDLVVISTTGTSDISTGWHHFALVRSGNNWYGFIDGVKDVTVSDSSSLPNYSGSVYIGYENTVGNYTKGYIDEFRVSSFARWTDNFTPPASPYDDVTPGSELSAPVIKFQQDETTQWTIGSETTFTIASGDDLATTPVLKIDGSDIWTTNRDIKIKSDSNSVFLGTDDDASLTWDSSKFIIDAGAADLAQLSDQPTGGTDLAIATTKYAKDVGGVVLQQASNFFDPADSTTYYSGNFPALQPSTAETIQRIYIPRAGTITRVDLFMLTLGVGSNETSTISLRKNATSDTTLSATIDNSSVANVVNATGLSISVSAGDYIEIKWVTPAWATNPTTVGWKSEIYLQ